MRIGSYFIPANINDYSAQVSKLNPNGNVIWANKLKSDYYHIRILDNTVDDSGNVIITANFIDNITIITDDTTIAYETDEYGGLIARFSKDGELIKAILVESTSNLKFQGVDSDHNGNIITTGWWYGTANFSGQILESDYSDIFIAKYDSCLNMKWIKQVGSETNSTILEFGSGVAVDKDDHIFISGTVLGHPDFGAGTIDATVKNIFLASYESNGTLRWVSQGGGPNGMASYCEQGKGLYIDNDDFIFLIGEFGPSAQFEDQTIYAYDDLSNGNLYYDVFVAKYYANGELSWVTHAGHENYDDVSAGIIKDTNNTVYITGDTRNMAQFGDNFLNCDYSYPGFVVQLKDTIEDNIYDNSGIWDESLYLEASDVVYPNPFSESFIIDLNRLSKTFEEAELNIYSCGGRLHYNEIIGANESQNTIVNSSSWKPGIYLFQVKSYNHIYTGKIIKSK